MPYRGAGPAMTDMLSGQVDLAVMQAAVAMPQVRGGTLKALANLSTARSVSLPDIPTSDEAGVPGYYMSGWFGLYAPKNTPPDVIAKLDAAMMQSLADPGGAKTSGRSRPRHRAARAADPAGAGGVPAGRDGQVVADHQGVGDQGGVTEFASPVGRGRRAKRDG